MTMDMDDPEAVREVRKITPAMEDIVGDDTHHKISAASLLIYTVNFRSESLHHN